MRVDPWEQIPVKLTLNRTIFIQENKCENVVYKMTAILYRPQCVNSG